MCVKISENAIFADLMKFSRIFTVVLNLHYDFPKICRFSSEIGMFGIRKYKWLCKWLCYWQFHILNGLYTQLLVPLFLRCCRSARSACRRRHCRARRPESADEAARGHRREGASRPLKGSFSALAKPNFARKYALEISRRDLHNALLRTALKSHFFLKVC